MPQQGEGVHPFVLARADEVKQLVYEMALRAQAMLEEGFTMLKATSYMMEEGARSVCCAVLCRRERGDVPVEADVVGCVLEVGAGNVIDLHIPPYEDVTEIVLKKAS